VLFSYKRVADLLDPLTRGNRKAIERHHLHPRAWLERNGVTDLKQVNQIANFAFAEWPDNVLIKDTPPAKYVPELRPRFTPEVWQRMCRLNALPDDWEQLPYAELLQRRRELMALMIRRGFETLGREVGEDAASDAVRTDGERRVWMAIEALEQRLREVVEQEYESKWPGKLDERVNLAFDDEKQWEGIERNREKHQRQYPFEASGQRLGILHYVTLGQLSQLIASKRASELFAAINKGELDRRIKAILPVRNDIAHCRSIPPNELDRARIYCDDVIAMLAKV
jgi:hypothetical protein